MTYADDLRKQTLTPDELLKVLADHGCYVGDYLLDMNLENVDHLPEYTDGGTVADWLGY
jgi:hypothetical protein